MILTKKSITKNISPLCGGEQLFAFFFFFWKKPQKKKAILAVTSNANFFITNTPAFGKPKKLTEFNAKDVDFVDFVAERKLGGSKIFLLMKVKGTEYVFATVPHPVNGDDNAMKMIKMIYDLREDAKPEYLKGKRLIDFITGKEGIYKFTNEQIIVQKLDGDNITEVERINLKDITDFDIYPQKMGTRAILYLEINNNPRIVKFEKSSGDASFMEAALGGTKAMFTLQNMCDIMFEADTNVKVPVYMSPDEREIYTDDVTLDGLMGIDTLSNKIFRLTTKNIYLLKKEKSGKLSAIKQFPLDTVTSYKQVTRRKKDTVTYGLKITTSEGDKITFWGIDAIRYLMEEMAKLKA